MLNEENSVVTDESQVSGEVQDEQTDALESQESATAEKVETGKPKSDPLIGQITKLRAKNREKDAIIKELRAKVQDVSVKPKVPNPEEFVDEYGKTNYSKYNEAMEKYQDEFFNYRINADKIKSQQSEFEKEAAEVLKNYQRKATEFASQYSDFVPVVNNPLFTEDLTAELVDRGRPDIAYYLGKNPAMLKQVSQLSYDQLIEAVDELENQFNVKKKDSKAPNPLGVLEGSTVPPQGEPKTDDEWFRRREAKRLKQLQG